MNDGKPVGAPRHKRSYALEVPIGRFLVSEEVVSPTPTFDEYNSTSPKYTRGIQHCNQSDGFRYV
jgi:hypothetical protein